MPYIKPEQRARFDDAIISLAIRIGKEGELNYVITKLIHTWLTEYGINYAHLNSAIGVLECAKASLIETVLLPYERTKIEQYGNISELDEDYAKEL